MTDTKTVTTTAAPVTVVDVDMPFWSMVVFMVKWALAAIPAVVILAIVVGIVTMLLLTFGAAMGTVSSLTGRTATEGLSADPIKASALVLTFRQASTGTTATNDSDDDQAGCSAVLADGSTVALPALIAHEPVAVPMVASEPKSVRCAGTSARVYWFSR